MSPGAPGGAPWYRTHRGIFSGSVFNSSLGDVPPVRAPGLARLIKDVSLSVSTGLVHQPGSPQPEGPSAVRLTDRLSVCSAPARASPPGKLRALCSRPALASQQAPRAARHQGRSPVHTYWTDSRGVSQGKRQGGQRTGVRRSAGLGTTAKLRASPVSGRGWAQGVRGGTCAGRCDSPQQGRGR